MVNDQTVLFYSNLRPPGSHVAEAFFKRDNTCPLNLENPGLCLSMSASDHPGLRGFVPLFHRFSKSSDNEGATSIDSILRVRPIVNVERWLALSGPL